MARVIKRRGEFVFRFVAILLMVIMISALTGCGGGSDENKINNLGDAHSPEMAADDDLCTSGDDLSNQPGDENSDISTSLEGTEDEMLPDSAVSPPLDTEDALTDPTSESCHPVTNPCTIGVSYGGRTTPEGMALVYDIWPKLLGYWSEGNFPGSYVAFSYHCCSNEPVKVSGDLGCGMNPLAYAVKMTEIAKNVYTITFWVPESKEYRSYHGAYEEYYYDIAIDISNIEAGRIKYIENNGGFESDLQYYETHEEAYEQARKSLRS